MKITFIGLGIMGSRMATHLLADGIELTVYNRNTSKADRLSAGGARVANSLADAVQDAEVVFTMLSTPAIVREVAAGENGFLQHLSKGTLWVDCSTVSPEDAKGFLAEATDAGINYLEAPVAGTKQPAERGELVFFVGGDSQHLELISPLLDRMGKKTIPMGPHGSAASIKIVINLMLAQSMLAFSEGVKLGTSLGLPRKKVMDILSNVPVTAPFLQLIQEKLTSADTTPNFPMQWMVKDLGLVQQAADNLGVQLPSSFAAQNIFQQALDTGMEDQDFSSIFHFFNR
ncbi:MAG: NAD(P)-dependent oxidoreductase [Bacteroidota bacterium]